MQSHELKRANPLKSLPSRLPLEKLLILVFSAVMICLLQSLPAQAGADQSGKCSISVELEAISDIHITDIDGDGTFGSIRYETINRVQKDLYLEQGSGGKMLPMNVRVNDRSVRLSDLRGTQIRTLKATRKDCLFSHPVIGNRPLSQQWTIRAELSR